MSVLRHLSRSAQAAPANLADTFIEPPAADHSSSRARRAAEAVGSAKPIVMYKKFLVGIFLTKIHILLYRKSNSDSYSEALILMLALGKKRHWFAHWLWVLNAGWIFKKIIALVHVYFGFARTRNASLSSLVDSVIIIVLVQPKIGK